MTAVTSSALLCQITVSPAQLESDRLLQLVLQLVSPLQVKVNSQNQKAALEMALSDQIFTQRNVILKSLVDFIGVKKNFTGRSLLSHPTTPLSSAALTAWMSVADSVKKKNSAEDFLATLNSHLEAQAFLLPTSHTCSLADLDLTLAILQQKADAYKQYEHVYRWLQTCHAMLRELGCKGLPAFDSKVPASPIFFDGTEDENLVFKSKTSPTHQQAKPQPGTNQQEKGTAKQQGEKAGEKKKPQQDKGKQQPQTKQEPDAAAVDVSALDIRVGTIVKAWHHPEAEKLFCEEIDLGNGEVRQIASGLRPFYQTDELTGRSVVVLCNLKKRNLVGFASHGMVLCASNADHTQVKFVVPPSVAKPGDRVYFGEFKGEPEPENKVAKKKIFEAIAPDLKTNEQGIVVWKDAVAKVAGVELMAELCGAHVS